MAITTWQSWNATSATCTNQSMWITWAGTQGTTAMCNATPTNVWNVWTTGATNATTTCQGVWVAWNGTDAVVQRGPAAIQYPAYVPPVLTEEQEAEQQRQAAERAEQFKKEQEIRRLAGEKAKKLLCDHLNRRQREEFEKHQAFHVVSKEGRRYKLNFSTHGNVQEVDEAGKVFASWCIQPPGVPTGDAVLAQKLMLETDEAAFRRIGNRTAMAV